MTNENVNNNDVVVEDNVVDENTHSVNTRKEGDEVIVDLYDANHGKAPRTGGPYLDDIERRNAETWRAQKENREPDYDNPPAVVSTVLVPKSQLVERDTDKSHFTDAVEVENEPVAQYVADTSDGFKGESDPTQPDFDNNYDRLNALNAGVKLNELKDKAIDRGGVSAQPDQPNVVSQDNPQPEGTADDFNEDVGNADNPEGIWNAPASDGENKVN